MAVFCQVCHRRIDGADGVGIPDDAAWDFAHKLGVALDRSVRICNDCLQQFTRGASYLVDAGKATPLKDKRDILSAAWGQVFVSDGPLPVGVLDLGHVSGYCRLFLPDFDAEIVNCEFYATSLLKNLTLARKGDAIYHFRVRLTGAGNSVIVSASGCAARTGKKTPELSAAWQLFNSQDVGSDADQQPEGG